MSPLNSDGSINTCGVPYGRRLDGFIPKHLQLDNNETTGWECKKCGDWVNVPPRECKKVPEPVDWWWCRQCQFINKHKIFAQQSVNKKLSAAATNCKKIDKMMKK